MFCLIQVPSFADCEGSKGWSCRIVAAPHCSQKLTRRRACRPHRHVRYTTENTLERARPASVLSEVRLHCKRFRAAADHEEQAGLLAIGHPIWRGSGEGKLANEGVSQPRSGNKL